MSAQAFVLHRRRYRDTSLLVELFTREHGRVGVVARGAASSRSGRAALLQPFSSLDVAWRGRGELPTLTQVESRARPAALAGNALAAGFYLNELVMRLTPRDDPMPGLFDGYGEALQSLNDADLFTRLRSFELRLLEEMGYGLDLDGAPLEAKIVRLAPGEGAAEVATQSTPFDVSMATLGALRTGKFDHPGTRREAKALLGATLDHYLGGYRIRSRELLR